MGNPCMLPARRCGEGRSLLPWPLSWLLFWRGTLKKQQLLVQEFRCGSRKMQLHSWSFCEQLCHCVGLAVSFLMEQNQGLCRWLRAPVHTPVEMSQTRPPSQLALGQQFLGPEHAEWPPAPRLLSEEEGHCQPGLLSEQAPRGSTLTCVPRRPGFCGPLLLRAPEPSSPVSGSAGPVLLLNSPPAHGHVWHVWGTSMSLYDVFLCICHCRVAENGTRKTCRA